jgi:hypothetical protein
MAALEDLRPHAAVRGVLPTSMVTVVSVQWYGSEAVELTYKDQTGKVLNELMCRHRSRLSMNACCPGNRCASSLPTTLAPARPSWPGF